jgi:ribosomal-protein-alanine N-acetyltransferase
MRWPDIDRLHPIERDVFGADGWSAASFWAELAQHETCRFVVAEEEDGIVGYAGLAAGPDEAFVQTLAVRRDRWGRGIGTALLGHLLAEAGDRPVLLEVRADDARPQALYRRHGFRPVGRRRGYYQPSGADAVVMRRG